MEPEGARAAALAAHLLARPALAGLSPLEKEEQALLLLRGHGTQLGLLLAGQAYLPGIPWERARELLRVELRRQTDRELDPILRGLLERDGALPFAAGLQSTPVSGERCREQAAALLGRLLREGRARAALCAPLAAAHRDLPGKYLEKCFEDRQYVHFELSKVERLRLGARETASFLRTALLLRAGIFLTDGMESGGLGPRYASQAMSLLRGELPALPPAVLRSAVMSHLPWQGNPLLPATARLTAAFAASARAGRRGGVRGALPPEESWWGIARRNASFRGLDAAMLEEMRGIAARNGW